MIHRIHRAYHRAVESLWLSLYELAPSDTLRLRCIERAADHAYADMNARSKACRVDMETDGDDVELDSIDDEECPF